MSVWAKSTKPLCACSDLWYRIRVSVRVRLGLQLGLGLRVGLLLGLGCVYEHMGEIKQNKAIVCTQRSQIYSYTTGVKD